MRGSCASVTWYLRRSSRLSAGDRILCSGTSSCFMTFTTSSLSVKTSTVIGERHSRIPSVSALRACGTIILRMTNTAHFTRSTALIFSKTWRTVAVAVFSSFIKKTMQTSPAALLTEKFRVSRLEKLKHDSK
jgi:hypothetical protein